MNEAKQTPEDQNGSVEQAADKTAADVNADPLKPEEQGEPDSGENPDPII